VNAERMRRFEAKVDRSGGGDACHIWTGARVNGRYGYFAVGRRTTRGPKMQYAHRVAYEIENGSIPDGLFVLHRCDNPGCVNPRHLFIGSQRDNMQDAKEKGRLSLPPRNLHLRGERHPLSKLTAAEISEIRAASGPQRELAARFHISQAQVSRIKNGHREGLSPDS